MKLSKKLELYALSLAFAAPIAMAPLTAMSQEAEGADAI